nr:hypothetical protein FVER53263_00321 [Fusarium verticillioides]
MDTLTHVLVLPEALERLDSPSIIIPRTANTSEEVVPYAHLTDLTQSLQHDLATLGISVGNVMILPPERAPGLEPNGDLDGIENTEPVARLTKELGVKGEICLRGKNIMAGYTNNPAANREAFLPNGFFRTGDLGVIKPRQYLALIGRVKEIINKGGEKISPAEIEHVARLHDQVNDAACFRISDEIYGEVIGLAITAKSAITITAVKKHMRHHVVMFKVPDKVLLVQEIPYNRTGKPRRTLLSEMYDRGELA